MSPYTKKMKNSMKSVSEFNQPIQFLLTDIDDTLTDEGLLGAKAYSALWSLHNKGIHVIPVTGRPAGWCEMIARVWPVSGIVGENGAFYFRYVNKTMKRHFFFDEKIRLENQKKLEMLKAEILRTVPGCAVASDQFCRLFDLAIDFCEDVTPLPEASVKKIVELFEKQGAQAKVSSIHVNGWFGEYNKLTMSLELLRREFGLSTDDGLRKVAFSGDSPNDEPMWGHFPNSFAVANIKKFEAQLRHKPQFVAKLNGGDGFVEIARAILAQA